MANSADACAVKSVDQQHGTPKPERHRTMSRNIVHSAPRGGIEPPGFARWATPRRAFTAILGQIHDRSNFVIAVRNIYLRSAGNGHGSVGSALHRQERSNRRAAA